LIGVGEAATAVEPAKSSEKIHGKWCVLEDLNVPTSTLQGCALTN